MTPMTHFCGLGLKVHALNLIMSRW